jgi:hypothetical protein
VGNAPYRGMRLSSGGAEERGGGAAQQEERSEDVQRVCELVNRQVDGSPVHLRTVLMRAVVCRRSVLVFRTVSRAVFVPMFPLSTQRVNRRRRGGLVMDSAVAQFP